MAAASRTTKTEKARKAEQGKCGAPTRSGGTCGRRQGAGTDHPGKGRCSSHGGGKRVSQIVVKARAAAIRLGLERKVEPHQALLEVLYGAAGWKDFCVAEVEKLRDDEIVVKFEHQRDSWGSENATSYAETTSAAELNIWVRELAKARGEYAKYAEMAINAGIAEREIRMIEQNAGELAAWLGPLLDDLGVKGDKRTPAIVRKHLILLEGGKAA